MWDPGSSTRIKTAPPTPALKAQSQPLDCQGSPYHHCFEDEEMKLSTTVDSCKLAAELEFKTRHIINNCSGCCNEIPQTGCLKQQKLIFSRSGGWKPKIKVAIRASFSRFIDSGRLLAFCWGLSSGHNCEKTEQGALCCLFL